jgi:heterodisulfide reductase subunit A
MISRVNEALCKGCGTCVAACPSGASQQNHFRDQQIFAEIEGLLGD